jgi:hypothetical protein
LNAGCSGGGKSIAATAGRNSIGVGPRDAESPHLIDFYLKISLVAIYILRQGDKRRDGILSVLD